MLTVVLLASAGGCGTTYLVKRADLSAVAALAPEDRPPVIPARREDGTQVFLRTKALAITEQPVDDVRSCFVRADLLRGSGQFRHAAQDLRECRDQVAPDERRAGLQRDLDVAIGNDDRAQLQQAIGDLAEKRAELDRTIAALEAGRGAYVSIPALRVAAPYFAVPSSEVSVTPRNRALTAAKVLAGIGGAITVGGIIAFASLSAAHDRDAGLGPLIAGITLMPMGGAFLITSAIVAGAGRHSAEHSGALERRKLEFDPKLRAITRARARRGALGSGLAAVVSLALIVTGAPLSDNAYRACREQGLYCATGNFAPPGGGGYDQGVAGSVLMSVGVAAFGVSFSVMASELSIYRNNGPAIGSVSASARPPIPTPWFTRDGGGLALAGAF